MTFSRTYTDAQRQAIFELKREGKSGRESARLLAAGVKGVEPFEPTPETVNRIYNEERAARDDLELSPLAKEPDHGEAFRKLVRSTISLTERQIEQLRRDVNRSKPADRKRNADATASLTVALGRLHKLVDAVPAKPEQNGKPEQPKSFLESLAEAS